MKVNSKLRTPNSLGRTPNFLLRTFLYALLIIIFELITQNSELIYSQDDYLEVKGNIKADSVDFDTFTGDTGGLPSTPVEGEFFYDFGPKQPYYYDGSSWKPFGGEGPKTVASRIVAASNSIGTTGCPGACDNPRAHLTCDGTDDQVTIQSAIDSLGSTGTGGKTGGTVYLLEGTYNITGSIVLDNGAINDSGKAIIGAGAGTRLQIVFGASNLNVINASNVDGILISQLMIDGNNLTGDGNAGINFDTVTYSKIDRVWIEWVIKGIYFDSSSNNTISKSHLYRNYVGIQIEVNCNNNIIFNNHVTNHVGTGIYLNSSSNNILSGNNIRNNGGIGIYNYQLSNNNIIFANNVQLNGNSGICLFFKVSNNIISGNNVQANTYNGIYLMPESSNNIISGNNVQGNSWNGIQIQAFSKNNIISSNVIYDNGGTGNYDGIIMDSEVDNNLISGNRISDSAPTGSTNTNNGIDISASTCDDNYLANNLIDGLGYINGPADTGTDFDRRINDSGTKTKYTDKLKMTLEKKTFTSGFSPLDVATNPRTYVALQPSGAITLTLANGKAAGDLLILENTTTYTVTVDDSGNKNLGAQRQLGQYDTLELIWNGTVAQGGTGKWLEVKYVDN